MSSRGPSSRRMTLGGGALREVISHQNVSRSADRRGHLEQWRRDRESGNTRDRENAINNAISAEYDQPLKPSKQRKTSHQEPPFSIDGTTAIDRFRIRRQIKLQQDILNLSADEILPSFSQDDDISISTSLTNSSNGGLLSSTPRSRFGNKHHRRASMSVSQLPRSALLPTFSSQESSHRYQNGLSQLKEDKQVDVGTKNHRRASLAVSNPPRSALPPTFSSQESSQRYQNSLSQLTEDEEVDVALDTVEGAGLRSRIREMQQRVEQLEKEKMDISISVAPLESRFRQKEAAWLKEQNRLLQEIDSLREAGREGNELYRDLQAQYEAKEEECKNLRLEIRKASSSLHSSRPMGGDNGWSGKLQNDRTVMELKEKLRNAVEEIDSIRLANVSLEKELHATKIELDSVLRSFEELQQEYDEVSRSTSNNREAEIKLDVLTTEHIATAAQLNAVYSDLAATKARAEATIEARDEDHRKELEQLHFEMSVLQNRAAKADDEMNANDLQSNVEDDAVLKARIEERDRRILELEQHLLKSEDQRRRMHNKIQELRGNIRVFVRARPFLPSDGSDSVSAIDVAPDGESLDILDKKSAASHGFKFDKVFAPSAGQDLVFQEVSDFVQSALDGYQVCLFSYGQTGSGKTHTMQGSGNGPMRGIIPRAVEQILSQAKALESQKWNFRLSASFLEIYNEQLKDLLVSMGTAGKSTTGKPKELSIKRNREGKSYVENLTKVTIETIDSQMGMQQLDALMAVAARTRSVAKTQMNAQSSRSHSVFILHLYGCNQDSGAVVEGALNLCDLAGSERLDRSGAGSDAKRLKETQSINKSLSSLGDVFNALAQKSSHVPYRNSKLTYLLQDCLSGDGKALMFVNLSPTMPSSNESLCSLRFAQRVNQVELGKPTKNIHYNK